MKSAILLVAAMFCLTSCKKNDERSISMNSEISTIESGDDMKNYNFSAFTNVELINADLGSMTDEQLSVLYAQARYCQAMTDADIDTMRELVSEDKFKFGGSVEKMECRPVYNWYKDIPDNMYVYFLGALSMKITFEWDNKIYQADGNVIDTCTFRFDMKEINDLIKSINNRSYMHLDISYYDGKARNNSIMVQRQLKIEPYFNEESVTFNPIEKTLLININKILFKDRATLYAEIEDVVNKSIVYDGELKEGNNVISNIDSTRNYSIRPYMIEKNGLFGTVRTSMRWFFINGKKTISNISDYHITIRSIYNKGKRLQFFDYLYGIDFLTMSNDNDCVFFGRFYAAPYNQKRPDFKNKKIIGNIMMTINKNSLENERDPLCTIAMLETDYNEYVELYYDIERKMLISPNNKRLHSNNYGKFIPLYENETVFCLELRLRKERKDVIQTN